MYACIHHVNIYSIRMHVWNTGWFWDEILIASTRRIRLVIPKRTQMLYGSLTMIRNHKQELWVYKTHKLQKDATCGATFFEKIMDFPLPVLPRIFFIFTELLVLLIVSIFLRKKHNFFLLYIFTNLDHSESHCTTYMKNCIFKSRDLKNLTSEMQHLDFLSSYFALLHQNRKENSFSQEHYMVQEIISYKKKKSLQT